MKAVFQDREFCILLYQTGWSQGLGMTGGLSKQVKMNVKPIGAFTFLRIRQMVSERRVLNSRDHCSKVYNSNKSTLFLIYNYS